jgi:hypothetical protein
MFNGVALIGAVAFAVRRQIVSSNRVVNKKNKELEANKNSGLSLGESQHEI